MSQEMPGTQAGRPWGAVTALLTACAATLIGVARGLDPWVILCRATCAACVAGFVVAVAFAVLSRFSKTQ
jgi:uncharacterized membrane protein